MQDIPKDDITLQYLGKSLNGCETLSTENKNAFSVWSNYQEVFV